MINSAKTQNATEKIKQSTPNGVYFFLSLLKNINIDKKKCITVGDHTRDQLSQWGGLVG